MSKLQTLANIRLQRQLSEATTREKHVHAALNRVTGYCAKMADDSAAEGVMVFAMWLAVGAGGANLIRDMDKTLLADTVVEFLEYNKLDETPDVLNTRLKMPPAEGIG